MGGVQGISWTVWSAWVVPKIGIAAERLGPADGIGRMSVDDPLDLRKGAVENGMGFCIGARLQPPLYDSVFQVHHDDIVFGEFIVGNAARFNGDEPLIPVTSAHIFPR